MTATLAYPPVQQALDKLKGLSADEETRARISAAPLDQLDLWADRILEAPTLTAVFDGH
jgi:hypothetical protein